MKFTDMDLIYANCDTPYIANIRTKEIFQEAGLKLPYLLPTVNFISAK